MFGAYCRLGVPKIQKVQIITPPLLRHAFDSVFKNELCLDMPMFSKYLATSINSYFFKMTLLFGIKNLTDQNSDSPQRLINLALSLVN